MARSIAALRAAPDDELIREHDALASSTVTGTQYFLDELNRRANERAQVAAEILARRVFWLGIASTVASVLALAVSVAALLRP